MTAASRSTRGAHSKTHTQRGGGSRGGSPLRRAAERASSTLAACSLRARLKASLGEQTTTAAARG
jgi:hypothetical protein